MTQNTSAPSRPSGPSRAAAFHPWKALQSVFSVALLAATLFTLLTPANLFSNDLLERMFQSVQPEMAATLVNAGSPTPSTRLRIGIVAGHWGNDSGSVCADGLTEQSVNMSIASRVKDLLTQEGYQVDLLKEFDDQLAGYKAQALVSIHNDSCEYVNDQATGFKVAAAQSSVFPEKTARLTQCLTERYQQVTGLPFHQGSVTVDMTQYHAFAEIDKDTSAAIIETGFLNLDRDILTNHSDRVAQGVAEGILCFVKNQNTLPQIPTVQP